VIISSIVLVCDPADLPVEKVAVHVTKGVVQYAVISRSTAQRKRMWQQLTVFRNLC